MQHTKYKLESIIIIKIGGNIIDDAEALDRFLRDFASICQAKVLVHGGGKLATQLSLRLNIEPKMADGRRITDEKTLEVVTMVYGGLINKRMVARLQALHCNALGMTGADANLIEAHQRINESIDYGLVGDIDKVNAGVLLEMLGQNICPVIAPLTHDTRGSLLNTNADTMAAELAIALAAHMPVRLIYCFEKKGLLKDMRNEDSVLPQVSLAEIEQLKEKQIITAGMLPKVKNIAHALENGVEKVILCHAQDLVPILGGNANFGTTFSLR